MTDSTKGYMREDEGVFFVGARSKIYNGPVAQVTVDRAWLHITTDDYEGHAMLNIEALPYLMKALRKIAKGLKNGKA